MNLPRHAALRKPLALAGVDALLQRVRELVEGRRHTARLAPRAHRWRDEPDTFADSVISPRLVLIKYVNVEPTGELSLFSVKNCIQDSGHARSRLPLLCHYCLLFLLSKSQHLPTASAAGCRLSAVIGFTNLSWYLRRKGVLLPGDQYRPIPTRS